MSWGRKFSARVVKAAMRNSISIGWYTCSRDPSTAQGLDWGIKLRQLGRHRTAGGARARREPCGTRHSLSLSPRRELPRQAQVAPLPLAPAHECPTHHPGSISQRLCARGSGSGSL